MQREIKFRTFQEGQMYFHKLENYMGSSGIINQYVGCDKAIWMQFTGLKDKNGVDIYEGDILDFDEKEWGGKFTPEVIKFECILGDWDLCGSKSDLKTWRKVIGNIHENPELL